jgi:hypothetical protein
VLLVTPNAVLEAADARLGYDGRWGKETTGSLGPLVKCSTLGDNTLAFSTCCQNRSEVRRGCRRINSSISLGFVFIHLNPALCPPAPQAAIRRHLGIRQR